MEDDLGESLIGGGVTRRRPQRYSTLRLWLRRTVPHWSIRQWLLVSLVGGGLLYYYNTPRYSSSPLADWSPEFKNSYGKTTAAEWERRADAVKDAFVYAYDWYERVATLSFDEFLPLTAKGVNSLNGWGLTAIDSLDTMILMGLEPQINRTIHHIQQLDFRGTHRSKKTLFFETTIRYLGGLLSAYHLTGNQVLLDKANYLGNVLLPAFNTPSQIPLFAVDTATGEGILLEWSGGYSLLAEMASCQMEFKYLAKLTGNPLYFEKVDRITTILERQQGDRGLWNTFWNVTTGEQVNDHYTIGAWADSAYEYLLKEYLLTDQKDERLATMYKKAVYGAISELVFVSPKRHMLYITDIRQKMVTGKFEHLSCFFPALLMLGVWSLPNLTPQEQELHRMVAHGLAESCWLMYKDMHTGLGAESVLFEPFVLRDVNAGLFIRHYDKWVKKGRPGKGPIGLDPLAKPVSPKVNGPRYRDYHLKQAQYRLRPETVETMYIMWKTTGNPIWRERAWEIFKNLEKAVRVGYGYATLARVDIPFSGHKDEMASFLFAETFKYLYLSFIDPAKDPWPLDQYVFNTEAHPFPQFKWTNAEQERYDAFRASLRP